MTATELMFTTRVVLARQYNAAAKRLNFTATHINVGTMFIYSRLGDTK